MDCSKTADFFHEVNRMCDHLKCEDCPMYCERSNSLCAEVCDISQKQIDAVQKWSDENPEQPKKTYADYFFECFPNSGKAKDGNPIYCKSILFGDGERCCLSNDQLTCSECWNESLPDDFMEGE